ncbi:MAG TPA: hypothetical protein VE033_01320 [Acetobacteraceae bacterium]|jgi:hypothetical protein|nr:hypothetical protein [Acetobacteraceae bacterium]
MAQNAYRAAFERLKADFQQAQRESMGEEALERARAALDAFAGSMVTDPRKLRWVAEESPSCAAEIRQWASGLSLPRQVLDPTHDGSYARIWAASLGDDALRMLRVVLQAEATRRVRA